MKEFASSTLCLSRTACFVCRNRDEGRAWRATMMARSTVPGNEVDWPCPHGVPWGAKPKMRGLGDLVERTIKAVTLGKVKPCEGCKKRRDALNKAVPFH